MNIIGYHISDIIANSNGEVCSEPPYLEWLLSQSNKDTIQVMYHMDYDIANLLRLLKLTKADGEKLLKEGKFSIQGLGGLYTITYYPSKYFAIDRSGSGTKAFAMFSNMAQYTDIKFPFARNQGIVENAMIAQAIGEQVYDALTSLDLHPRNLISPISVYRKEMIDGKLDIPTDDDLPDGVGSYAYECAKGAWLEAFKLGHFPLTYDYDISSAYAFQLAQLPDLRLGEWHHIKQFEQIDIIADIGFIKGRVTMIADFHPIIYKVNNLNSYTPTGSWDTIITLDEWLFIREHNLGTFEPYEAYYWEAIDYNDVYPFNKIVESLHKEKESNGSMKNKIVKRILAGLYGLTLQIYGYEEVEMGKYFNPVYGALVETRARLEVARFCLDNNIVPLHITVDGVLTDKDLPVDTFPMMGDWNITSIAPTLISSTGAVAIKGKQGTGDFALSYEDIMQFIAENPDATSYEMKKLSPVTLAGACKGNWPKLGSLETITRSVDFGNDTKRAYIDEISSGSQLINSQVESIPWEINLIR